MGKRKVKLAPDLSGRRRHTETAPEVLAANTDYPHALDYVLDRPHGFGDVFVLIHCLTPCEMGAGGGRVAAGRGDIMVYRPGDAQWNRGCEVPLRNNWVHFRGGEHLLLEAGIPCNRIFRLRDDAFLEPAIQAIKMEIYQKRCFYEALLSLRLRMLLWEIARQLREADAPGLSPSRIAHAETFRNLRALLMDRPEEAWSIARMAEYVHLSRSRFCALYREFFEREPLNDLIDARLRKACLLLSGSNLTVEAVAVQCGFHSVVHFHRLFRKRYHASPRRYCPNEAPYGPGQHHL